MSQAPHFQRAMVLQSQGRHDLVEKELRQHLAEAPMDGFAHAVLALSLVELDRVNDAEKSAREAIGLAPDSAFPHYAMARVMSSRNREDEAARAIQEAIRLEPDDADYHGMLAAVEFDRRRWRPALDAAETGLQFDPEHVNCNNLRAMALVKLGRKAEAGATIDSTLSRDPDNAVSHANKGWTLLEQGRRKDAMGHFRESLRLDPASDWARAGLVEAIKAGNPLYALMLKYFLWMAKLSSRAQWGIILGGYIGNRMLGQFSRANPAWSPWVDPIRVLYVAFALLTWLAHPLFNLMLFLHPQGRHALSDDQRRQASWIGLILGLALAALGVWFFRGKQPEFILTALVLGLLAIPAMSIFACERGWPRLTMAAITALLAAAGLYGVFAMLFASPADGSSRADSAAASLGFYFLGIFVTQFAANWLIAQKPRR